MSRATELLEADGLYGAARATDQSGQRGWDFRPEDDEREPSNPAIFIPLAVVMIVGLSFIGAIH